ncbi:MAG: tyrosine recombinase XerC [Burkholderiales bacterium]|nr:tyrosine recombinase XerC [Burkholderiales bacterium]
MSADEDLGKSWLEALEHQRRLSGHTLANYSRALALLFRLKEGAGLRELEPQHLRRYVARLHAGGLSGRTLALTLSAWRGFYRFLARQHGFAANPAHGVRAPKAARLLPRALSVEQARQLLEAPAGDAPADLRDRAMYELLYSSGLRLAEIVALNEGDGRLDLRQREVTVTGKGAKTRTVPVGSRAAEALRAWLKARAQLAAPRERALFVGARGRRIAPSQVQARLRVWARRQGLGASVHPHMLRHSFASHVLQSSQDLRAVQEMLGHASISTTQVYTHLDFQALAKVYDAAHPRARRK